MRVSPIWNEYNCWHRPGIASEFRGALCSCGGSCDIQSGNSGESTCWFDCCIVLVGVTINASSNFQSVGSYLWRFPYWLNHPVVVPSGGRNEILRGNFPSYHNVVRLEGCWNSFGVFSSTLSCLLRPPHNSLNPTFCISLLHKSFRERTYVSRYLCSPVPMFPGTDVPRTCAPRCLCSRVPICSPVSRARSSPVPGVVAYFRPSYAAGQVGPCHSRVAPVPVMFPGRIIHSLQFPFVLLYCSLK